MCKNFKALKQTHKGLQFNLLLNIFIKTPVLPQKKPNYLYKPYTHHTHTMNNEFDPCLQKILINYHYSFRYVVHIFYTHKKNSEFTWCFIVHIHIGPIQPLYITLSHLLHHRIYFFIFIFPNPILSTPFSKWSLNSIN